MKALHPMKPMCLRKEAAPGYAESCPSPGRPYLTLGRGGGLHSP